MEERLDLGQDNYVDMKEVEKAVVLIRDCMQMNEIPIHVGISAFSSLTASMYKQHSTYEEYEKAILTMMRQAKQQWDA